MSVGVALLPEEIAQDYSMLQLADLYAVTAYYLRHQGEVERYHARSLVYGAYRGCPAGR